MSNAASSQETATEITLESLLGLAIKAQQSGRLDDAGEIYSVLLQAAPEAAEVQHFYGLYQHQRGDNAAALEWMRKSIATAPGYADAHNNLGNLLLKLGETEAALDAYRAALAADPTNVAAHGNLGIVMKRLGRWDEAIEVFRRGIESMPHNPVFFQHLTQILSIADRDDEALTVVTRWLELEPENPVALHKLASLSGQNAPERASDAYVKSTFDAFADSFDDVLKALQYRAPALTAEAVTALYGQGDGSLDVLDAGCGTGLCGAALRPYAKRLIGIDLSGKMLERARPLGVYDDLAEAELVAFLNGASEAYDLIVSADTLVYFGDLQAVATASAAALKTAGRLVFTVELAEQNPADGYRLNPHGRYSHTEAYVRNVLSEAGMNVLAIKREVLRKETGKPVVGLVVSAGR